MVVAVVDHVQLVWSEFRVLSPEALSQYVSYDTQYRGGAAVR